MSLSILCIHFVSSFSTKDSTLVSSNAKMWWLVEDFMNDLGNAQLKSHYSVRCFPPPHFSSCHIAKLGYVLPFWAWHTVLIPNCNNSKYLDFFRTGPTCYHSSSDRPISYKEHELLNSLCYYTDTQPTHLCFFLLQEVLLATQL